MRLQPILTLLCAAALAVAQTPAGPRWVAAWTAAPDQAGPDLKGKTIRQVLRVGVAGSRVRVRLSNLYGTGPILLGPLRVARHGVGPAILPGSSRDLTFGGRALVTIPKGGSALSDPVAMDVTAQQELALSLYLPGNTPSTIHGFGLQTAYLTTGDDLTAATTLPGAETDDSRYFVSDVEVEAAPGTGALVAFGDSITDGVGSPLDGNGRWPDALAACLQGTPLAVLNSGIAGNRILNDAADPFVGPSGLSRFDRDALDKPGVRWVLLLQGVNDITGADVLKRPQDQVTAEQIIAGLKTYVRRAHAKGVKVYGATLLPRGGAAGQRPHTPAAEAKRLAVNAWIRSSGTFDALVDFEQVVRDPAQPDRLRADFDSGDHTHPNAAGYKAMAAALDLRLLGGKP